ncbi:2-deoxyglucose-6-phosphatase [Rathayibacter rathayi]|uniref:2-deoxyglucose-6-phosphatase n=1 Tax=Rathayibacter rathayi TaxID=33887 RepID=A0ABD6WB33_RATRA|nr:HAD-IA family hydrolase [Rathayibacter rathayi]PPF15545.1 2-deoxyglucose-6-phosphatase [Rathayibacter rathayi]PPH26019.1 2-deoxyglucose-6-phosphatase [Rathayibacter rathayi]PPH70200.1 2-deoxyglucose-6-phosphatase [Rathayibacter rathayi]
MPHLLRARAALFDMDGTLVDSTAVVETIWSAFAERFSLDHDTVLGAVHGVRAADSVRRFAPAGSDVDAIVAELDADELEHTEGTVEIPGASAFLASLPRERVALVTSASPPLATGRLAAAGVPSPDTVITAHDVANGKPAPDGYLAAAALLGVAPEDALVFEDAEAGIRAGLDAGMRVIVVGSHESASTRGLPRITNYSDARAAVECDDLVVTLGGPR